MIVSHRLPQELGAQFDKLSLGFLNQTEGEALDVEPTLEQDIRKGQKNDPKIQEIKQTIADGRGREFHEDVDCILWYKTRLYVPKIKEIRDLILKEAHETA